MVVPPLYVLCLPLLITAIPFIFFRRSASAHGSVRLPPSPWALPVIGHMHHLSGALPHRAMRELARRLGPLMLLRLGELRVVVASSADAAREVMRTHDVAFATRPISPTGRVLLGDGCDGLIFAPYGDGWRQLLRICAAELFSSRRVRSFRAVREEEVRRLLRSVAAAAAASPVNLSEMVSAYVADASVRAIIGSRFRDRDTFLRLLERRVKVTPVSSLPDLFPSSRLAMLLSAAPRIMRTQREEMMAFIDTIIQGHHQENRASAGVDEEEDLLDVLLRIQEEDELDPPLTTDNIKAVIVDIFAASSETSATTLQWIMAELMRNPRVMRKAQDEVRRVLAAGGKEAVTEDRLGELRYLPLVIKEALRLHPPATLLLPRECRSPCRVLGYDVPVGAMVLVNAWAIGRDPSYWDAPQEFMPERFENTQVDFRGTDFEFIPFGAGRRMCPGIGFGLANMDLALASLLYHFDWELPEGMEPSDLDMTEALGITTRRLSHLLLLPTVRVPLCRV
ncbi:unnamed protein product [Urochloa humidicola]